MGFRMAPKSVILNDLKRYNAVILHYSTEFGWFGGLSGGIWFRAAFHPVALYLWRFFSCGVLSRYLVCEGGGLGVNVQQNVLFNTAYAIMPWSQKRIIAMEILYKLTRTFHLKYSTRNSCAVRKRSYCMIYSDLTFKRIPLLSVTFSYIDDYDVKVYYQCTVK